MNKDKFIKEQLPQFSSTKEKKELFDYLMIDDPISVTITKSNETGEQLFAVTFSDWSDFWLAAFKTKEEAESYCAEYQMEIKMVSQV